MNTDHELTITDEFKERIKAFKKDWYDGYKTISNETTPQVDGNGQKIIQKRPDNKDYIIESYMRDCLDRHFPGWSWESAAPLHFLGAEWVVAQGHLIIIDEHLTALGINPPLRRFYGVDSVRIQYKQGSDHIASNIIDVGDNCKQANTAALKYAINRLCRIGDDVYGKRVEEEGAGTLVEIFESKPSSQSFAQLINEGKLCHKSGRKLLWSEVLKVLKVKSLADITDYTEARTKIEGYILESDKQANTSRGNQSSNTEV